jgi:hypothetical protein
MPKRRVLGFKPQPRLERGGEDDQRETEKPDHPASLRDFVTSSTGQSFRYTQGLLTQVDGRADQSLETWSLSPPAPARTNYNQTCLDDGPPASLRSVTAPSRHVSKRATAEALLANSKLSIDEVVERTGIKRDYIKRIFNAMVVLP